MHLFWTVANNLPLLFSLAKEIHSLLKDSPKEVIKQCELDVKSAVQECKDARMTGTHPDRCRFVKTLQSILDRLKLT